MQTEPIRPIDLSLLAAKKRLSPRTGFVHFFYGHDGASDTIPLYENMCYAIALLQQRKAEAVLEAKDLLLRLLAFQTAEGNFPVYLHDYPRCHGFLLGLKVAPLLWLALRTVGAECREKIEEALQGILSFYAAQKLTRQLPPIWEYRYQMCRALFEKGELPIDTLDTASFSTSDWWEYWVTKQFQERPTCAFFHSGLGLCTGPFFHERAQEGMEPSLALIDWACVEKLDTARLLQDHPSQMGLAALEGVAVEMREETPWTLLSEPTSGHWDLLWKDSCIHRLSLDLTQGAKLAVEEDVLHIELPPTFELQRDALFEVPFYIDASPGIALSIGGVKGTSFALGDWVEIRSAGKECVAIRFMLVEGEGDFCGHIYRSCRPNQRLSTESQSFDWKIGLRTLRRSEKCVLSVQVARAGLTGLA